MSLGIVTSYLVVVGETIRHMKELENERKKEGIKEKIIFNKQWCNCKEYHNFTILYALKLIVAQNLNTLINDQRQC